MLNKLASDEVIDTAYAWLCHQRQHWPADSDVWWLRAQWSTIKPRLQRQLLDGSYRFEPLSRITKANGEVIHIWSAQDALVLKALAAVLGDVLPISPVCTHVKGHGGAKLAVRSADAALPEHQFVMKTDVKGYYEHIDHHQLLDQLSEYIDNRVILNYLWQVMRRTVTWGGLYRDCERGISRGCPLSPLLGAFYCHQLDEALTKQNVFYVRFMDDLLVLAKTRWSLRRAIKTVNQHFARLGLSQHPDKTFIGRIDKGFDFLGYRLSCAGLRLSRDTMERFVEHFTRLYEQERSMKDDALGQYVRRWLGWAVGGLYDKQKPRQKAGLIQTQLTQFLLSAFPPRPAHTDYA